MASAMLACSALGGARCVPTSVSRLKVSQCPKVRKLYVSVGLTEAELVSFWFSLAQTVLSKLGQENGCRRPPRLNDNVYVAGPPG